ncbi:hypothetical protein LZ32DRAFT_437643 [Colletotrichum eremochloae]|nr:hypothetical protein LZ32DRAFT_437643 [Colletotrichum eremochloae]
MGAPRPYIFIQTNFFHRIYTVVFSLLIPHGSLRFGVRTVSTTTSFIPLFFIFMFSLAFSLFKKKLLRWRYSPNTGGTRRNYGKGRACLVTFIHTRPVRNMGRQGKRKAGERGRSRRTLMGSFMHGAFILVGGGVGRRSVMLHMYAGMCYMLKVVKVLHER